MSRRSITRVPHAAHHLFPGGLHLRGKRDSSPPDRQDERAAVDDVGAVPRGRGCGRTNPAPRHVGGVRAFLVGRRVLVLLACGPSLLLAGLGLRPPGRDLGFVFLAPGGVNDRSSHGNRLRARGKLIVPGLRGAPAPVPGLQQVNGRGPRRLGRAAQQRDLAIGLHAAISARHTCKLGTACCTARVGWGRAGECVRNDHPKNVEVARPCRPQRSGRTRPSGRRASRRGRPEPA